MSCIPGNIFELAENGKVKKGKVPQELKLKEMKLLRCKLEVESIQCFVILHNHFFGYYDSRFAYLKHLLIKSYLVTRVNHDYDHQFCCCLKGLLPCVYHHDLALLKMIACFLSCWHVLKFNMIHYIVSHCK